MKYVEMDDDYVTPSDHEMASVTINRIVSYAICGYRELRPSWYGNVVERATGLYKPEEGDE